MHRRLRADLGEDNYAVLRSAPIISAEGIDVTMVVAAAIITIQGMHNTATALAIELDERGVGHTTASNTVNRPSLDHTILYLARSTVFAGTIQTQGLGTDARNYSARPVEHRNDQRLTLTYDGHEIGDYPREETSYPVRPWAPPPATIEFD